MAVNVPDEHYQILCKVFHKYIELQSAFHTKSFWKYTKKAVPPKWLRPCLDSEFDIFNLIQIQRHLNEVEDENTTIEELNFHLTNYDELGYWEDFNK